MTRLKLICPTCNCGFQQGTYCPDDGTKLLDVEAGSADDPLVGRLLSQRYSLEECVGSGGMGTVYRGRHVLMDKPVAVKVLKPELSQDPYAAGRFRREARSASRIEHEHCVAVTDFGQEPDGTLFLVMEYLEGPTLWKLIKEGGALSVARVVDIARQILGALQAAHEEGIVHRDLKPENVMLVRRGDREDVAKVLDFGLAKVLQSAGEDPVTALTRNGMIFGTPRYMSPEQVEGREVDHRADLYALGVMLYEMATGVLPFEGRSVMALLNKHLHETPTPPSSRFPRLGLPARLEALILALMAKPMTERPPSAAAVLDELEAIATELASEPSPVPSQPPTPLPTPAAPHPIVEDPTPEPTPSATSLDGLPPRRGAWALPALLGAAVAVVATLAVLRYGGGGPSAPLRSGDAGVVGSPDAAGGPDASPAASAGATDGGASASRDAGASPHSATQAVRLPPRRPLRSTPRRPPRRTARTPSEARSSSPVGDDDAGVGRPDTGPPAPSPAPSPVPVSEPRLPTPPAADPAPSAPVAAPSPRSATEFLRAARRAMWHQDHVKAGQLLTEAQRLAPRSADVHAAWADFYFERERFDAAQKAAQRAVELRPGGVKELLRLAQVAFKRGDRNLACSSVREVLRRRPREARAERYLRKMRCP